jgi:hypothetical protein
VSIRATRRRQISNSSARFGAPGAGRAAGTGLALAKDVHINRRSTLLAISLSAVSSPALAQMAPDAVPAVSAPRAPQMAEPPPPVETYSAQIVAADLGGLVAFTMLAGATNEASLLLLQPLGAPVVHAVHGHFGRAFGSLVLNVGLPIAGAFIGASIDAAHCGGEEILCGMGGVVLGGMTGIASAVVIDAAVLARLPDEAPERERAASAHGVTPLFALNRDGGLSLGLGGRF